MHVTRATATTILERIETRCHLARKLENSDKTKKTGRKNCLFGILETAIRTSEPKSHVARNRMDGFESLFRTMKNPKVPRTKMNGLSKKNRDRIGARLKWMPRLVDD
jgi:hypothetical protein